MKNTNNVNKTGKSLKDKKCNENVESIEPFSTDQCNPTTIKKILRALKAGLREAKRSKLFQHLYHVLGETSLFCTLERVGFVYYNQRLPQHHCLSSLIPVYNLEGTLLVDSFGFKRLLSTFISLYSLPNVVLFGYLI